jgi:hypothetical protein
MQRAFEIVTIAHFFPRVAKEGFKSMARVLRLHMLTENNVGTLDCPIGDAFVGFNSQLERNRFLDGPPLNFHGYSVTFVKHDEGNNASTYDMDREVWLLLLGCHVHESDGLSLSHVIIKVSMSSKSMVPHLIAVGVGDGVKIKTWTVPVYVLSASSVPEMGDEDSFPPAGDLHPLPPVVARLMWPARDHPFHGVFCG